MVAAEEAGAELSRADLRRAQVLEAAAKCFNREGFHGASMASIAAEASMSVGQIYRHFENKEAVIEALVEQSMAEWTVRMAEVRARPGGAVEQLIEVARHQAEKMLDQGMASLSLEFLAEAARNPRIAGIVHKIDDVVRTELTAVLVQAGVRDDAALAMRLKMIAMLIDGWAVRAVKDPVLDREAYLRALRPLFESLVAA